MMSDALRDRVARAIQRPPLMRLTSQDLWAADAAISALAPELAIAAAIAECAERGWTMEMRPLPRLNGAYLVALSWDDGGPMTVDAAGGDILPVVALAMARGRARWGEGT